MNYPSDYFERPIGMFDSGLGGLTVMKKLIQSLPKEQIVYFGDTARLPYGDKSQEAIIQYSIENALFLLEHKIKALVVACNTASAYAIDKLQQMFNIPVIGVIEPGVEKAVQTTRNQRIAVLGTKGTIRSEIYQKEIIKRMPDAVVIPIACPLFVPLVEEGFATHPAARLIAAEYLQPLLTKNVDTVLLGCTHYPILKELISEILGESVQFVDSASACTEKIISLLHENQWEAPPGRCISHRFYASDDPAKFQMLGKLFLGADIDDVTKTGSKR